MFKSGKEKTTRTASRVSNSFGDLGVNHINNGFNERTGSEILTGSAFLILSVLFKDGFVDSALEIALHHIPVLAVDHFDDFGEHYRTVDFVGCFREDSSDQTCVFGKFFQDFLISIN